MRIVILSRGRTLYSTQRIAEAGRKRKHDVRVVDPYRCTFGIVDDRLVLHCDGLPLDATDVVIPRVGASSMAQGLPVLRHFELLNVPTLNSSQSIALSRDKLASHQVLAAHGVAVPTTLSVRDVAQLPSALKQIGTPTVIKLHTGTQGNGVMVADTETSATAMVHTLWALNQEVMLQEFIDANGKDLRVFIVGNRVVGAMQRSAADGEFRANIHLGASAEPLDVSPEITEIALKTAQVLGLSVAGVDIIEGPRGPLVLEANSSTGLQGIEEATGYDIARSIILHAESLRKQGDTPDLTGLQ